MKRNTENNMDYEKMYKDALSHAKQAYGTGAYDDSTLEAIFPELRESNNERIRKYLLSLVDKVIPEDAEEVGININDVFIYLEKQKELPFVKDVILGYPGHYFYDGERMHFCGPVMEEKQKEQKSESCEPDTNVEKVIEDVIRVYGKTQGEWVGGYDVDSLIVNLRRAFNKKEQKPSSKFRPNDWAVYDGPLGHAILQVKDVVDGRYTFVDNDSTLLVEDSDEFLRPLTQKDVEKPAGWSDTNELVFQDICKHLQEEGYGGWVVLLRALRNGEFQPKQEWSEEDEAMRLEAIRVLVSGCERYRKESGCLPGWHKVINWLKSLRCHWKPNDEDEVRLINTSISFLKDFADKGYENAVECIDWLKSKLNGNTCE